MIAALSPGRTMTRHLYIITGASRGLGAALADRLLAPDHHLLCLARRTRADLAERARDAGSSCEQWSADLADPTAVSAHLETWLRSFDASSLASATLINNAGMLTRIGPLDHCSDAELSAALRVGLEAPLLLTAAFLRASAGWPAKRRVLNISSGLGRRAMAGQAAYCAAKAGMDHFSRALALDEAERANGAAVVSLAPGVVDTDMQVQLRAGDPAGFPDHQPLHRAEGIGATGLERTGRRAGDRISGTAGLRRPAGRRRARRLNARGARRSRRLGPWRLPNQ